MSSRKTDDGSNDMQHAIQSDHGYAHIESLWALRILCHTEAGTHYLKKPEESDPINRMLNYSPTEEGKLDRKELSRSMESQLEEIEKRTFQRKAPLFENLRLLSGLVELSPLEQDIIASRVLTRRSELLDEAFCRCSRGLSNLKLCRILAVALGTSIAEIENALRPDGVLLGSGLMKKDEGAWSFLNWLTPISGLGTALLAKRHSAEEVIAFATQSVSGSALTTEDFSHVMSEVELICRYAKRAKKRALPGVNFLFHGLPGVGKTELVKLIAGEIGCKLFEIKMADAEGNPLNTRERLEAYRATQRLLSRKEDALILFDEIEDVMPDLWSRFDLENKPAAQHKAWTNRVLEENPVPAFWVANKVSHIDPAFLRRFDYIMELRNPPISKRKRVIQASLGGLAVPAGWVEWQAQEQRLTPAFITRTAKVLHTAGVMEPAEVIKHFEVIVRNQLEARGDFKATRYPCPENYKLEFVNTNADLVPICQRLVQHARGKLLLYGPPGSGKTAFAHHLAQTVDRPLVTKRASDILSPYLGETEENIARMFREAPDRETVLLLDEADSLLHDRQYALRSWEVTQVNELLTQMECFDGIFICATNFREHLDSAAMRRFGIKIEFRYLNAEQVWRLFMQTLDEPGVAANEENDLRHRLISLTNLTPGDFLAARQCVEMEDDPVTPETLLEKLKSESRLKPDGGKPIGFNYN